LQKETRRNSAAGSTKPNPPRKLTRAEKKQIAEIIRQAKGDGKAHTAQQTIPYIQMYPDGICKVTQRKYSKTVAFEDINYQLAQADDKTAIFENWCDFLNYFDASVSVQLSFINQGTQRGEAEKAVNIPAQDDAFNSIRTEYRDMLKNQLAKGNNGLVKAKYITFAIEADSLGAAKSRLARIETGEMDAATFRKGIEVYAAQITEELLQVQVSVADGERIPCPKCQSGRILFYPKVAKCSNVDCGLTVFRSKGEKTLTDSQITDLVTKGKTSLIKGFKNRDAKAFDAHITFDKDFRTVYDFPPKPKGKGGRR